MAIVHDPLRETTPRIARAASYLIGSKLFGTPLMMRRDKAEWLRETVMSGSFDAKLIADASRFTGEFDRENRFRVTDDGVAILSIGGMLLDRGAFLGEIFGGMATSYEGIVEQCRRIGKEESIKGVVIELDSPGGAAAGVWEAAASIAALDKVKPVFAVAYNEACSAAYALGCAARKFYVTSGGCVGSIGVIKVHVSSARAMADQGYDPTIISAGEHKADGAPFLPLSVGARAKFSQEVDDIYEVFCAHVAKHRPGLTEADVRATEAAYYIGSKAVSAKLVDGVASESDVLKFLRAELRPAAVKPAKPALIAPQRKPRSEGKKPMEIEEFNAALAAARAEGAQLARQQMEAQAAAQRPQRPSPTEIMAERTRCGAIMNSELGRKLPTLAAFLAFETDVDADVATGIMTVAAEDLPQSAGGPAPQKAPAPAAAADSAFAAAMAAHSTGIAPETAPASSAKSFTEHAAAYAERMRNRRKF